MSYQMQYQQPSSLQTPEQRQMGMFLHLSQLANADHSACRDRDPDRHLANAERKNAGTRRSRQDGRQLDDLVH